MGKERAVFRLLLPGEMVKSRPGRKERSILLSLPAIRAKQNKERKTLIKSVKTVTFPNRDSYSLMRFAMGAKPSIIPIPRPSATVGPFTEGRETHIKKRK